MSKFYRRGPDHRYGDLVGFVELRRRFNFRSIEIGRWVYTQRVSSERRLTKPLLPIFSDWEGLLLSQTTRQVIAAALYDG